MKKILLILGLLLITGCAASDGISGETLVIETYGAFTMPEYQYQKMTITPNSVHFEVRQGNGSLTYEHTNEGDYSALLEDAAQIQSWPETIEQDSMIADVGYMNMTYQDHEIKRYNDLETLPVDERAYYEQIRALLGKQWEQMN